MTYIPDVPSTFLTTRQAADRLDVHINTVYQWVRKGVLTPVRVHDSAEYRFRPEDVEKIRQKLGLVDEAVS